jgi:integrase
MESGIRRLRAGRGRQRISMVAKRPVIKVENGKTYGEDGEEIKRFGFHSFRHSLTSWLMANGENPQVVRAMLRWTNLNMLAHYAHSFSTEKLAAQGAVLEKLVPERVQKRVQGQSA